MNVRKNMFRTLRAHVIFRDVHLGGGTFALVTDLRDEWKDLYIAAGMYLEKKLI